MLKTKDLSISFGNHQVLQDINLQIPKGKFLSIIGPNGAGKTTLFNLLSGQISPTKGKIFFKDEDITKLSVAERARRGMGRSFQLTNVFPELAVLENVRLGIQANQQNFYHIFTKPSTFRRQEEEARDILKQVLLMDKEDILAKDLAHGEKRKLELAMLIALKAELILLDEPTAGISIEEVPTILQVIENIKNNPKHTIILIEHKMDMVLHLSDHLIVLFNGKLLAEGAPEDIIQDKRVQAAYLGGTYSDALTSK